MIYDEALVKSKATFLKLNSLEDALSSLEIHHRKSLRDTLGNAALCAAHAYLKVAVDRILNAYMRVEEGVAAEGGEVIALQDNDGGTALAEPLAG